MTDHTDNPYILFNKTLDECRRLGACGGRAQARNRRLRQLDQPQEPQIAGEPALRETAAEAIAVLDALFPWLRGAEKRKLSRRSDEAMFSPALGSGPVANRCAAAN